MSGSMYIELYEWVDEENGWVEIILSATSMIMKQIRRLEKPSIELSN